MQENDFNRESVRLVHYEKKTFEDGKGILKREFLHPNVLNAAIMYMTIFMLNDNDKNVFSSLIHGASIKTGLCGGEHLQQAKELLEKIQALDDESLVSLCKLATYDVWAKNPAAAAYSVTENDIRPDKENIQNLRTMISRNIAFWKENGLVKSQSGFWVPNGITETAGTSFFDDDSLAGLQHESESLDVACWLTLFWYWNMAADYSKPYSKTKRTVTVFHPGLNTSVCIQMEALEE